MTATPTAEAFSLHVVQTLQQAGFIAYWAGGCVRDRLMGRTPKDYDVATSARPEEVLALFPRSQKVGAAFGVVLVRNRQLQVEVATFREDGTYSDGRHPDSVRFTTPQEDARRRDFTCNGLFLDPLTDGGQLHDFVGGQTDIAARTLRAIGDPRQRFAEDHLRMLRAIRFAARLEFAIDPGTRDAMVELQQHIATISRERIGEEVRMMLEHPTRLAALTHLAALPVLFDQVFGMPPPPEAAAHDWPLVAGLPAAVSRPVVLAAMLLDDAIPSLPLPAERVATLRARLMLSNEETDALAWCIARFPTLEDWEDLSKATLKRLMADPRWHAIDALYRADPRHADQLLAYSERIATLAEEGVAPPPFITGNVLMKLGVSPGRQFKGWLETLYDRQLNGDFSSREDAIAAARSLIQDS